MRPVFQPRQANGPFGDPALFVDVLFERRALLFGLGELARYDDRDAELRAGARAAFGGTVA